LRRGATDVAKGKPDEKPEPTPEPKPEPKPEPVEEKAPVNPATGEREVVECLASLLKKVDTLTEKVTAQGKAIEEWGTKPPEKTEKPASTSAPEEKAKPEPLDEWSN
jgi:hypothetical protein